MLDQLTHSHLDLKSRTTAADPVWPLPTLNGRAPSLIRSPTATRPCLDLAYARAHTDELITKYPPGSSNGSASHFMPSFVPAFAVRYGEIMYAGKTGHAHSLIVDHRDGWATFYSDLEHMFATPTVRSRRTAWVRAGEVLGYVGAPAPGAMKCLRFELWKRDDQARFNAVDPIRYMRSWSVLPWTDERLTLGGRS